MTAHRYSPMDRPRAEHLLSGEDGGSDPIARLLAGASAPPRAGELAGEDAAIRAYRLARLRPGLTLITEPTSARPHWRPSMTLKVAAAAAVVVLGGLAVAAEAGVLPNPLVVPVDSTKSPGGGGHPGPANPAPTPRSTPDTSGTAGTPATTLDPSTPAELFGLCHAFRAHEGKDPAKVLGNAAYAKLVAAAGGEQAVPAFCATLLAPPEPGPAPSGGRPTVPPTGSRSNR